MKQLSPQDAQFLAMETGSSLAHGTTATIYDPSSAPGDTVRFEDIVAHVESRLHSSPIFKRRLMHLPFALDYPYWVADEYFDLEYHIRRSRLPEPGNWRQLCDHLSRYHSRPLDMHRPLWEMHVIEGIDRVTGLPEGSFAVATKIHHCTIDGTTSMNLFAALSDSGADGTPALEVPPADLSGLLKPGPVAILRRATLSNIRSPALLAQTLLRAAPALIHEATHSDRSEAQPEKTKVPQTRFNVAISPNKTFDSAEFPLDELKQIRSAIHGATVNDVVLTICSGGLRRYLDAHNELPNESLVAWCPVNARPKDMPDDSTVGNNISAMKVPIYTNVDGPLDCLRAVSKETRRIKAAKGGARPRLLADVSRSIPAPAQTLAARLIMMTGLTERMCNLFVSNVAGPQRPMYMKGARARGYYGLAPLADGMGLFVGTPSYDGRIGFSVTSTREILPDIEFFIECLCQSFESLRASVDLGQKSDTSRKRKTVRRRKNASPAAAGRGAGAIS